MNNILDFEVFSKHYHYQQWGLKSFIITHLIATECQSKIHIQRSYVYISDIMPAYSNKNKKSTGFKSFQVNYREIN